MALPVTGPFVSSVGGTGDPDHYHWISGYRQVKPFDRVLAYEAKRGDNIRKPVPATGTGGARAAAAINPIETIEPWSKWAPLKNRAYDQFKSRLSDRASLGTMLGELGETHRMIANRANQLWKFTRQVKSGNFAGAARTLKMSAVPPGVSRKRAWAGNWLEYNLGWKPVIGDIGNAVDVLQSPIKSIWVSALVRSGPTRFDLATPQKGENPTAVYPANLTWHNFRYWYCDQQVGCGAEVQISNPNLWLANQLGFINPLAVAWELVPMSFVIDWFVNVGQVLNSMTDFYGLTLTKEWTTSKVVGVSKDYSHATYRWKENGVWVYGGGLFRWHDTRFSHIRRLVGLPNPTFALRPYKAPHLARAATAISLLVVKGLR